MAKGARASVTKANNARLKAKVFGPVETARMERLSAKLMELVAQPKPKPAEKEVAMEEDSVIIDGDIKDLALEKTGEDMEIDGEATKPTASASKKGRVEKRRKSSRKASIVFPKYKNGKRVGRSK